MGSRFARRYKRYEKKVVRIIRFTAVFFAVMTPKNRRNRWSDPPIARTSPSEAMRLRGVAQTMNPNAITRRRYLIQGRKRSAPGMRSIPSQR